MTPHLLPGDRVDTERGYGTVVLDQQDWSMDVCDAAWHHAAGGQPPRWITVRLDRDGGEMTFLPGEVRRLAQAGTCDP